MKSGMRLGINLGAAAAGLATTAGWSAAGRARTLDYASTGVGLGTRAPATGGFAFPAEWGRHERTLMQFLPPQNWYLNQLKGARREWADVANAVAEFEPVTMAVRRWDMRQAKALLSSEIELVEFPLNDGWSRDSGPMILTDGAGGRRVAGFEFNGWGGKFPPYGDDALAKARFAKHLGLTLYPADLVLEGGAVAMDGEGTLITTEQCLLNRNRNPDKSKAEIDAILKGWLGVEKIIWVPKGLAPDPITDGHIDGMVAFVAPGVVLLCTTDDQNDQNFAITREAKKILTNTRDARGRTLEIVDIPLTSWNVLHINFYICNGGVIVPTAGKATEDDVPLAIIREAFPDRKVVPITGAYLAEGGGGVHCITQQVPVA